MRNILTATILLLIAVVWLPTPARCNQPAATFLTRYCAECHGPNETETSLAVHELAGEFKAEEADRWASILERLQLNEMPPEEAEQPSAEERLRVIHLISAELQKIGKLADLESSYRDFSRGNYVNHDALFNSDLKVAQPAEPRLWRLSPQIYAEMADEVGGDNLAPPFSLGPGEGIKDYAAAFAVDESAVVQLLRNATAIVQDQTRDKHDSKTGTTTPLGSAAKPFRAIVETPGEPSQQLLTDAITYQFDRVLQRPPTPEELTGFTELTKKNIEVAGKVQGLRSALTAVLLMPEAVFRFELGEGEPDEHGRIRLSDRELAYAIAYALTDDRPDGELRKAAGEERLSTKEDVRRELERLWSDPKQSKSRILRFFHEYFGYHKAPEVFKDNKDLKDFGGRYRAEILVHDTDQLVNWILERDQNVFKELLTTNKSFANFRIDRKKGPVLAHDKNHMELAYNVPIDKWSKNQPIDLPENERAGILTQPSWLVAHSDNLTTHPIKRGKWVRERLLGGTVPDLPITVDAQLPDTPEETIRQRMAVTNQQYCWQCHRRMNPLGLPFESYGHLGRFRELEEVLDIPATEANVDKKGNSQGPVMREVPVDSSGAITRSGDAKLDGEVDTTVEMIRKLAESDRVRQVFVRHVFRYFMGRNERLGDAPTLIAADKAYVESGGSFKALVFSILTSDSFLYRRVPSAQWPGVSQKRSPELFKHDQVSVKRGRLIVHNTLL